jgi:hypothetical protein
MGFDLNTKAYNYFIQIEVGIREFLIDLIREQGIKQWMSGFLGSVQRDTIQEISLRIAEANKKGEFPEIEDTYFAKLYRAKKDAESSLISSELYHPFYYLNWPDLEALINMKNNTIIIERIIGKTSREYITNNLKLLNNLRNDIAHARFISENDFNIIKASFEQLARIVPNITESNEKQTIEGKLGDFLKGLEKQVEQITKPEMLSIDEIGVCLIQIDKCTNSFWLNSLAPELVNRIEAFRIEIIDYEKYRQAPGGLIQIQKWKERNNESINELLKIIRNGKI